MDQSIAGLTGIDAYIARMQALKQIPHLDALTHDQLSTMPMDELAFLRNNMFTDQASQNRLAPYEHRAYARELSQNNPLLGPLLAVATPAYQASKVATGGWGSRTGASLEQMKQGLIGAGEGTYAGLRGLMQ